MEQYIDETPWDGFRFGALNPPADGALSNISWNHHRYDIAIGPGRTALTRDHEVRFEASAGVIVRKYALSSTTLSFAVKSLHATNITTREVMSGTLSLKIDDQPAKTMTVQRGGVSFAVPTGDHLVTETWTGILTSAHLP
jgi:hypothetical protein